MKQAGFTEQEFEKLTEAERNSNDLVNTETRAMEMVASHVQAASGDASPQALMHDENYHGFKAKIMKPVDEFFAAVDERTQATIDAAEQRKAFWYAALIAIAAALVLSPIVWRHFFVLLLVPLALSRPRFDAAWLIPIGFWVGDGTFNGAPWQTAFVLGLVALTFALCELRPQPAASKSPILSPGPAHA